MQYYPHLQLGMGAGNPGIQGPGDDRRGRGRDYDERAGKSVLLVSELNTEVMIVCANVFVYSIVKLIC